MINIQNLISQLMMSNQPQQMLSSLLNPQQQQIFSNLKNKSGDEQAAAIAQMCNEKGITKEHLAQIIGMINKK